MTPPPCVQRWFLGFKGIGALVASILVLSALPALGRAPDGKDLDLSRFPKGLFAFREPYVFNHNVGLLTMRITNLGFFGSSSIVEIGAGRRGGE